jgi:hypothetical protein
MKNQMIVAKELEKYTFERFSVPNMIEGSLEIESYDIDLLLRFYDKIKLNKSNKVIDKDDKVKKVISLLNAHIRSGEEPIIERQWDKGGIDGTITYFYLPLKSIHKFKNDNNIKY